MKTKEEERIAPFLSFVAATYFTAISCMYTGPAPVAK